MYDKIKEAMEKDLVSKQSIINDKKGEDAEASFINAASIRSDSDYEIQSKKIDGGLVGIIIGTDKVCARDNITFLILFILVIVLVFGKSDNNYFTFITSSITLCMGYLFGDNNRNNNANNKK